VSLPQVTPRSVVVRVPALLNRFRLHHSVAWDQVLERTKFRRPPRRAPQIDRDEMGATEPRTDGREGIWRLGAITEKEYYIYKTERPETNANKSLVQMGKGQLGESSRGAASPALGPQHVTHTEGGGDDYWLMPLQNVRAKSQPGAKNVWSPQPGRVEAASAKKTLTN